jgi:tRNA 2-thiouridine synthesizing protein B
MLHIVNKSPFERNTFESCLRHAGKGAAVLFIEDGIYAALKGTQASAKVQAAMKDLTFYVLQPDVEARGMNGRVLDGVKTVDYGGFVDLTVQHDAVQSWL